MSQIEVSKFRINNEHLLKIKIDFSKISYDKCIIEFVSQGRNITVVSTSVGSINKNSVIITKITDMANVFVSAPDYSGECLISFLSGGQLINSESIPFVVDRGGVAPLFTNEIDIIKSSGSNFNQRMKHFFDMINRRNSKWRINISVQDDIMLSVKTTSRDTVFVAIGEIGHEMTNSDLIFTLYPNISRIIIPSEIIVSRYNMYKSKDLCCSELVKPDFCAIDNIFYKSKISNTVNIRKLDLHKHHDIDYYKMPTGTKFESGWHLSSLNLPVMDNNE